MDSITVSQKPSIFPILWIMFFDHVCLNVYIPVFTLIFFDVQSSLFPPDTSYTTRSFWYGLCLGLPHVGNILFAPVLSALSDNKGRKKILIICTFGAILFSLIIALGIILGTISLVVSGAVIQGIFSRTNPIAQAAVSDISMEGRKTGNMGYLLCAICAGAFIGPLIGGYFAHRFFFHRLNFSLPFFIAAVFAAMSFSLTLFSFSETIPVTIKSSRLPTLKSLCSDRRLIEISVILLFTQAAWSLYYQSISPVLKKAFHFTPDQLGLFMGLIAIWLVMASSVTIRPLEKIFSPYRLFNLSLLFMLTGSLMTLFFFLFNYSRLVWIGSFPIAMGDLISYLYLVTLYSESVSVTNQGKVMGICFLIKSAAWGLTGMLSGILLGKNTLLPLMLVPVFVILSVFFSRKKSAFIASIPSVYQKQGII